MGWGDEEGLRGLLSTEPGEGAAGEERRQGPAPSLTALGHCLLALSAGGGLRSPEAREAREARPAKAKGGAGAGLKATCWERSQPGIFTFNPEPC